MKVRTQDGRKYLEFGEIHVSDYGDNGRSALYVTNCFHMEPVCIGVYEDISRAKGVLYEIDLAYQRRQRIFYAPAE